MKEAPALRSGLYLEFVQYIDRSPKTTQSYTNALRQFASWLASNGIRQPVRGDILSYRNYLEADHKPATVAAYIRAVCQFFRWTAAAGYYPNIAENIHAPKIRRDIHKKDALRPEDVAIIETALKRQIQAAETPIKEEQARRLYSMFLLAVTAGLRTIEIHRANVKDIEERNGKACIYIWGKGHAEPDEKKPLAREVHIAIKEYLANRAPAEPLFAATGNRSGGKRLSSTTISTMLKRALQAAGYDSERLTAHSLRHTAGTAAQLVTGDIYQTAKYMRHANTATTEIYLHINTEKQEERTAQEIYNLYHTQGV